MPAFLGRWSRVFVTPKTLTAHAQIARNKDHRLWENTSDLILYVLDREWVIPPKISGVQK